MSTASMRAGRLLTNPATPQPAALMLKTLVRFNLPIAAYNATLPAFVGLALGAGVAWAGSWRCSS